MSSQQVKIKWPFKKGEKARLIWIGDPFRNNNKMMLHAYFRARSHRKDTNGLGYAALLGNSTLL